MPLITIVATCLTDCQIWLASGSMLTRTGRLSRLFPRTPPSDHTVDCITPRSTKSFSCLSHRYCCWYKQLRSSTGIYVMEGMPVRASQRQQVLLNHLRPVSAANLSGRVVGARAAMPCCQSSFSRPWCVVPGGRCSCALQGPAAHGKSCSFSAFEVVLEDPCVS